MKRLSIAIAALGAIHLSFWVWAPWIARWQARNLLARYDALDALEVAMEIFNESMQFAFLVAAILGALMLAASFLLHRRHPAGWGLWLVTLAISFVATILTVATVGPSGGTLLRLVLLASFAYASVRMRHYFREATVVGHTHGSTDS